MSEGFAADSKALPGSINVGRLPDQLRKLESESIEIMREVVAEFRKPVMLYSIGKDSSVMLHLAIKAFYPSPLPFPLLHVDTTWKFREMISFRDETARRLGLNLLVYVNEDGVARGISPIASGSALHTHVMKTEALKQALDKYGFDAAFGGARRDEEKSRAKERIFSFRSEEPCLGPARSAARSFGTCSTPASGPANRSGCFRCRIGPNSTSGATSWRRISRWCRFISPRSAPVVRRGGTWIMVDDERLPLEPGESPANAPRALPHLGVLSALRRDRIRRRHRSKTSSPRWRPPASRNARAG